HETSTPVTPPSSFVLRFWLANSAAGFDGVACQTDILRPLRTDLQIAPQMSLIKNAAGLEVCHTPDKSAIRTSEFGPAGRPNPVIRCRALEHFRKTVGLETGGGVNVNVNQGTTVSNGPPSSLEEV